VEKLQGINMISNSLNKIQDVLKKSECLHDMNEVNLALDTMAKDITVKLKDSNPLILCVMIGALVPTGQLVTRLNFPLEVDYIHATRYRGTTRGGDLHWLVEPRQSLKGRTVLVIDDIMDGGLTLSAIIDYCKQAGAKDVYTAVMVSKKRTREAGVNFEPDFVGLITEDKYLFGFGLDYEEYLRNAPGIYAVAEEHQ
jgi:hypoxanthine phosphoribosyltransferase